ncbi:MAG TPA: hypothetical protein VIG64_07230, partial [Actinomycetota bacterium]
EWGNVTAGHGYEDGEDLSFANFYEGKGDTGTIDLDVNGGITSLYVERISQRDRGVPPRGEWRRDHRDARGRSGQRDGARRKDSGEGRARKGERPGDGHGRGDRRGKA